MASRLSSSVLSDSTVSSNGLKLKHEKQRCALNTSPNANSTNGSNTNNKKPTTPTDNRAYYKRWSISDWLNGVSKREKKQSPINNQPNFVRNCTDLKGEQQTRKLDNHSKEKHSPSMRSTASSHFKDSLRLEDKFDSLSLKESPHLNKYKSQVANKNLEKLRTNSFKEQHTNEPSRSPRLNRFFKELNENKRKTVKSSNDVLGVSSYKSDSIRPKTDSQTKFALSFNEPKSLNTSNFGDESLCGCDSNNNTILKQNRTDLNESLSDSNAKSAERTYCVASYVNTKLSEYFSAKAEEWRDYHHNLVDSHCHLEMIFTKIKYYKPIADYFDDFKAIYMRNFEACIDVICDPLKYKTKLSLEKYLLKYGHEKVRFTLGCHPHFANEWSEHTHNLIYSCLKSNAKIVAIGECGLDTSKKNHVPFSQQVLVFEAQLKMANETGKPIVIHCRNTEEHVFNLLKKHLSKSHRIHLHCFTGGWQLASKYLNEFENLCIGVTPLIGFNVSLELEDFVRKIPLDRLLLETDAPYFVPRLENFPANVQISHPGFVFVTAECAAKLKNVSVNKVLDSNRQNVKRVYGF